MEFSKKRFQNLLIKTIEAKNEFQFNYIVNDLKVNLDLKLECLGNLSIFETILSTPNSWKFIEMCLHKGCNFYQKNCDGIYPLHYAVESLSAKNLNTLVKLPMTWFNYLSRDYSEVINHTMIVNVKLDGGDNYLHFLINHLNQENADEVSEMIKTMLLNRCNPNLLNDRKKSPFFLLMQKFKDINDDHDLINFFINNSFVELCNASLETAQQAAHIKDFTHMNNLLEHWDEDRFVEDFEEYKNLAQLTEKFGKECEQLFEAAVARNFAAATSLLLKHKENASAIHSIYSYSAFSACFFGYHQVLKVLLTDPSLKFKCDERKQNLLQKVCTAKDVFIEDRLKCFDLLIGDPRCTLDIINELDGEGQAPLYYACFCGFDEIAKELLRRGAFIGRDSIINCIDRDVLEEFLDECIKCQTSIKEKACTIHVDYRFLTPPDASVNPLHSEVNSVHSIANNEKLKELILHPVFSSFLNIKWNKINFIVYFNLLVYATFMFFMGIFIVYYFQGPVYEKLGYNTTTLYYSNGSIVTFSVDDIRSTDDLNTMNPTAQSVSTMDGGKGDADKELPSIAGPSIYDKSYSEDDDDFDGDDEETTVKPQSTTMKNEPIIVRIELPSEKPNLLAMIFGFSSDKSDHNSRKKRSTTEVIVSENTWTKMHREHFKENQNSYRICFFGVILLAIYEIMQCARCYKTYFFKLSNWIDICMIVLFTFVLVKSFDVEPLDMKKVRAFTILVMAAQSIQIVAKISILSMSLHMAIFKRVCATFLKTIALYFIMILAFAMSFFTLNEQTEEEENKSTNATMMMTDGAQVNISTNVNSTQPAEGGKKKSFQNVFSSVITTVRMMLSDFEDAGIDGEDTFEGIIFLAFVVLITVVLFNLLNALAISDTNEIMKDAELVDTKKRISILNSYEQLFDFLALTFANVFPEMSAILIKPNRENFITIEEKCTKSDELKIAIDNRENSCCPVSLEGCLKKLAKRKGKKSLKLSSKVSKQIVDFVNQRQRLKPSLKR